jgi:hypothetical protein
MQSDKTLIERTDKEGFVDSKNVALGAFVVLTLVFASIAAIEYSRVPSLSTVTRTSFSTTTSTETTTTTSTTVYTTSIVSVSTVTAAKSAAFALSVRVDRQDCTTNQPILVNGSVSPAPNAPSNVTLVVTSGFGVAATATSRVSGINGSYSYTLVAGGSSAWVSGVYTVTAICVAFGATETATTQFNYSIQPV